MSAAAKFTLDETGLWVEKTPEASQPYTLDFSAWLAKEGVGITLASASFTVASGITKVSQTADTTTATVRLSGGALGQDYPILCAITLSDGRTDSRSFTCRVRQIP